MTSSFNSSMSAAAEPLASRREIVAAAVTVAAAVAGTTGNAQAQTPPMLRFSNPPGMSTPPTYSHVVEVNGPHRTVYLAGQTGVDATGKIAEGFRAQAVQVMENLKTALASVGGGFEHVVKLNSYLILLCHKFWCPFRAAHGQRESVVARAATNLRRIVAIEFGTWRSGRNGGSSGLVTFA